MLTHTQQAIAPTGSMADVANTAQLVSLWLATKRSKESHRAYENDIRAFVGFLLSEKPEQVRLSDIDLRTININDVQAYADFLETHPTKTGKPLAPASRARRISAVKSLLAYGCKIKYLQFNAADDTLLPKPKDTLAERILSEMEVMTMVALTTKERDRLLIQLLYYTGARVGEVAALRWRDIRANRDGRGQVTLFGKGEKSRTVLIPQKVYEGLLGLRSKTDTKDAAVFKSRKGGQPLKDRQIRDIVAAAGKKAGIQGKVSPHWLRHSHASHSLDRGAPVQLVQRTLGHSSLHTTSRYAHAKPSDSSGLYLPG
ncbi:tyrosine-type recombinase/integrase [Calothrix sp. FACHB-156]|nr:tyrosine-type recombinase/integrase [Calothrix sp. FACHB-156]